MAALLPPGWAEEARLVDQLFFGVLAVVFLLFLATEGALIWFLIRYRATRQQKATYVEGSTKAEIIWTTIAGMIVLAMAFAQVPAWIKLKIRPPDGPNAYRVQVWAQQFSWVFRYPGADNVFGTRDDFMTMNDLRVPVGRPVILQMRTKDVIHSFFVPPMRIKQDVVPGYITQTWFTPKATGELEIACAELCGQSHYAMRAILRILPESELQEWIEEQSALALQGKALLLDLPAWPWRTFPSCSALIPVSEVEGGKGNA